MPIYRDILRPAVPLLPHLLQPGEHGADGGGQLPAGEGGEGVGGGPGLGVLGKGVPVLALEHLVLQKVGDAGGDLHKVTTTR